MKEVLNTKEEVIQKFFQVFVSDCRVKVEILHDVDLDFIFFHVFVYTRGRLPMRVFHQFDKYMKKQFNLDCCELIFDSGCGFFSFEMY